MSRLDLERRFWAKVDKRGPDECWLWTGATGKGYGRLACDGRTLRATHVSWELANGKPFPAGMCACHTCDTPQCVNPAHLWPGTQADNIKDAFRKGRVRMPAHDGSMRGSGNPFAKLNEADVQAIRAASGSQASIARRFGVSTSTVNDIILRKIWRHVP